MSNAALWADLTKSEHQADGSLLVRGRISDETIDIDRQIADGNWLKGALPKWFAWGNVREMHNPLAVGKAMSLTEIEGGGFDIEARVIDKAAIAKVEAGVLQGFSIGIKGPRIVTDKAAQGGRIVGGEVVEVSLVDRPANPNCRLEMVKAASAGWEGNAEDYDEERGLVRTETLVEKAAGDEGAAAEDNDDDSPGQDDGKGGKNPATGKGTANHDDDGDGDDDTKGKAAQPTLVKLAPVTAEMFKTLLADDDVRATIVEIAKDATKSDAEAITARLEKVEKMAAPGTPARQRTQSDAAKAARLDDALTKAAKYRALAEEATDRTLAEGYRELAKAAEADANSLTR